MTDLLYHGAISRVDDIDLSLANPKRDFGAGFYTTSSLSQAVRFSKIVAKRNRLDKGVVSRYGFATESGLEVMRFAAADSQWLDFVLGNRGHSVSVQVAPAADLIIGPVANDHVGQTLNLLMTGAYGDPYSEGARAIALSLLLTQRLVDQWVFKTDKAIRCLEFLGAEDYEL